ncbi:MAG: RDD family protein [Saprospiraceae bacterium]
MDNQLMNKNKLNLAGQGQRIINLLVDMITFFIIWIVSSFVLMVIGLDQTWIDESGEEIPIVPVLILVPVYWGYYIITEYFFQKTLGKLITKTKVVSVFGDKPPIWLLILRTLCRSIPFEYFSFLVTVEGIHDILSKTRVIFDNPK